MGIFHMGQRNIIWVRISKDAYKSGFRLSHLGVILRVKLMEEFPSIVDKVQITIITDQEKIEAPLKDAIEAYKERDQRIAGMTDESVENFYSCTLCQSFAPTHVCIITPERLGLCGAYNWLDGKAAHEINPTGPNRPVQKGKCLDPVKGKWEGVNEFVYLNSSRTLNSFSAYSILDDPMTSCGCFECIVAVLPGTCGVMAVDREFSGMTPVGMTFSTLAGMVGGGQQVPGFIGIGTYYISSKKFISAEGGIKRLVWTTNSLKKKLKDILPERLEEIGMPDFFEKVADESVTSELDKLVEFLVNTGHPALEMGEMI
jgi:acetyl-CoA synthase